MKLRQSETQEKAHDGMSEEGSHRQPAEGARERTQGLRCPASEVYRSHCCTPQMQDMEQHSLMCSLLGLGPALVQSFLSGSTKYCLVSLCLEHV